MILFFFVHSRTSYKPEGRVTVRVQGSTIDSVGTTAPFPAHRNQGLEEAIFLHIKPIIVSNGCSFKTVIFDKDEKYIS